MAYVRPCEYMGFHSLHTTVENSNMDSDLTYEKKVDTESNLM